jgi:hypothetical protein
MKYFDQIEMPVPRVLAYDATNDNALGFAWILMEFVPGVTCHEAWRHMSMEKKETLVLQLARYQARLFSTSYSRIGSLYYSRSRTVAPRIESPSHHLTIVLLGLALIAVFAAALFPLSLLLAAFVIAKFPPRPSPYSLGPVITRDFYHITADIDQGPFLTTYDWLYARLQTIFAKYTTALAVDTKIEFGAIEENIAFANRIIELLPRYFPPSAEDERFYLHTHDVHAKNLLVDEHGNLLSMIDWENVAVVPTWQCCTLPPLLRTGIDVPNPPDKSRYPQDAVGISYKYWIDLRCHEMTLLRKVFLAEMERLQPAWVEFYHSRESVLAREFAEVIRILDCGIFWSEAPYNWLDKLERGEDVTGVLHPPIRPIVDCSDGDT